jgi:hypothetical protein
MSLLREAADEFHPRAKDRGVEFVVDDPGTLEAFSLDETLLLQTVHQFHRTVVPELQPLRQISNARFLGWWNSLQGEHELVMLRLEASSPCGFLAKAHKTADLVAKFREGLVGGCFQLVGVCHGRLISNTIVLRHIMSGEGYRFDERSAFSVSSSAMSSDPERERLAHLYFAMSDEELAGIAENGDELSAAAQEALQAEIARRGLKTAVAPPRGVDVPELNETVMLRRFRDLPQALLAQGSLESAGIHSYLVDDNMVRMDWFISNLLGGIKLNVRPEDAEAGNEILNQPIPEEIDIEGIGQYEQPKCPRCQSLDVWYRELNKLLSYGSAYVGVPIPVHHKAWTCHNCGNEWEEENIAGGPS